MPPEPPPPLVVTVGLPVVDHRFWVPAYPPTKQRTDATAYRDALGGPAAVAAVAVTRLGGAARLVAAVGDDANGRFVLNQLENSGVATELVRVDADLQTGVCSVLIDDAGERYIVRHVAALQGRAGWIDEQSLAGASAVLVHPAWHAGALQAAEVARSLGLPVVVDLDRVDPASLAVAELATHVIADSVAGQALGGPAGVSQHFDALGIWWAVTVGADGVHSAAGHVPAIPVTVVDSTGAGDVFHGAFTLALAEGQGALHAVRFATAAAAAHVAGGRPPARSQLRELLAAGSGSAP